MTRLFLAWLLLFALKPIGNIWDIKHPQRKVKKLASGLIRSIIFQDKHYLICEFDPSKYTIELFNQLQNDGSGYTFTIIAQLKKDNLVFAMNAGMYQADLSPVGLFVSGGQTYRDINLAKDKPGNFYQLMPNCVFIIDNHRQPHIVVSGNFASLTYKTQLATQSGPMLVTDGAINSNFKDHSTNLNIRNAIGINDSNKVIFVISQDAVNFYEFAQLFKTELRCNNALYMDGLISQYYAPELQTAPKPGALLGTFITVSK